MFIFLISLEPDNFGPFQSRFPILSDAVWVEGFEQLKVILKTANEETVFIIDLKPSLPELQSYVLTIRSLSPKSKVIFVTEVTTASDLKAHQFSPVGGDAYVHRTVDESTLEEILAGLKAPEINISGNRLERPEQTKLGIGFSDLSGLEGMRNNHLSHDIDEIFKSVIRSIDNKPKWQSTEAFVPVPTEEGEVGEEMSDKDKELSLEDLGDLEIGEGSETVSEPQDDGLDLDVGEDAGLDLSGPDEISLPEDEEGISLDDGEEGLALDAGEDDLTIDTIENLGELDLSASEAIDELPPLDDSMDLGLSDNEAALDLTGDESLSMDDSGMDLSSDDGDSEDLTSIDLSDDAKEKLKEIDAIMDFDASQASINLNFGADDLSLADDQGLDLLSGPDIDLNLGSDMDAEALNESLVSEDLNLDSINFGAEEEPTEKPKKKKKEVKEAKEPVRDEKGREFSNDLKEISGAYAGEMERTQATISNLRSDRGELLAKIQHMEEEKMLQNRQNLSLRAELDEKKIELTIIRKKLNEEITELRDRLKVFDEKKSILEEKNRHLQQALENAGQKNKLDVKKVQMRERELEQKLELLKSDAENQIRNRDLKILELKRKIDAMEFDMESISSQEKRSVESRYELEDKLEKAIKTLRGAITVLEDESERGNALEALKKNIDM